MIAWIPRSALLDMMHEADRVTPDETGGILIGYWVSPGPELVITTAVGPGLLAIHERRRFVPDGAYHEQAVCQQYEASGRMDVYLGDWHTHPGGEARLSGTDRRTLAAIAHHADARLAHPIMAILNGGTDERWHLSLWRYEHWPRVVAPLAIRLYS